MISRRDDADVVLHYFKEEQQRNQPFLSFPRGGPILIIFCVVRSLAYLKVRIAPHALNMVKIDSAQVMIVLNLLP